MKKQPKIILSSLDFERLDALLDEPALRNLPGAIKLRDEMVRAEIVEPADMPPTTVTMNSTVSFKMLPEENEIKLTLVYPKDANGDPDRISVLAPVGSALLGLSVGQKIEWPTPSGKSVQVEIISVSYQPERSGVFHR